MSRIAQITVSFGVTLAIALAVAIWLERDESIAAGEPLYAHRHPVRRAIDSLDTLMPPVVWMGDSTMMKAERGDVFPRLVSRGLGQPVMPIWLFRPANDPFHHYYSLGPLLERPPAAIVIGINFRLLDDRSEDDRSDLASFLSVSQLGRAATLPLHVRNLTYPRLLMYRLMRAPFVERSVFFFSGLRDRFHDAAFWPHPRRGLPGVPIIVAKRRILERYDAEVRPSRPTVRMLEAAIRDASEAGIPTLAVALPMPFQQLERLGLYDARRQARRVEVLREVVEAAGGRFVDLHVLLGIEQFADESGHYTEAGHLVIADRLVPELRAILRRQE